MTEIIFTKSVSLNRQGNKILDDISLSISDDQHLSIIGPNGAGKSFLLQILSADLIPSKGQVKILGKEFGKVSLWDLRKEIGFVSNRMLFWYDSKITCLEIVCSGFYGTYGLPEGYTEEEKQKAQVMLKFFDIEYLENRKFEVLSDGERRKVLLSRAIITDPKLLIFDEPCQGLDIPSREHFLADVDSLAQKTPIIYVTHHLEELPSCITDVLLLKNGKIFEQGQKDIILTSEKISTLFDYQLEVIKKDGRFYLQHTKT